jgi:predicted DsbA family dithiol-disulfide isomerase
VKLVDLPVSMRIEIWSDVVCPWCYIGKRRLETALSRFEHADEVEITWRSYQLDPAAPTTPTETVAEHLGRKYGGGPAAGQQMIDRVEAVAAEEGLVYRLGQAQRVGTIDAHRLLHLASEQTLQAELEEALFAAYFIDAQNVADHDVLARIAGGVGLDEIRVKEVLAGSEYADAVEADIRQAAAYGATGVPFFVVDQKYGVSGAQPVEVFSQVLERAWAASRPQLDLVGGADACGPDGCPV